MDLTLTRAIVERASHQLDLITRPDLHDLGVTKDHIHRARRAGLLVPVGRRTFSVGTPPPSFERRAMAACLDTGGVASHRTAAALHPLQGFHPSLLIEVIVPHHRRHSSSALCAVHGTTNLPPNDIVPIGPIPTTSVARTLLGLAALVPAVAPKRIATAIDAAVRDGVASDAWLWWHLEQLRCRGRNGVTVMDDLLHRRQQLGPSESWLERRFLEILAEAGMPLPAVQRRISRQGSFVARVDTLFEHVRLVVELEGHATHSTRGERAQDERRRTELMLAGYDVVVFTYDQVVRTPTEVVDTVQSLLARRQAG